MLRLLFGLAIFGLAALAIRGARRGGDRAIPRLLRALFIAAFVTCALHLLVLRPVLSRLAPVLVPLGAVAGLVAWALICRLAFVGMRRRVWFVRIPLLAIAAILWLVGAPWGVSAAFAIAAVTRYRWTGVFSTRTLFRLSLLAIVAALALSSGLGGGKLVGSGFPSAGAYLVSREMLLWARWVVLFFAIFAVPALFIRFARDPTLGIRHVNRRLALSHTLAIAIPLVLVVLLWGIMTYLGVNADRSVMAVRLIGLEASNMRNSLREALVAPGSPAGNLRALANARRDSWPRLRLYVRGGGAFRRVAGDSIPGERHLEAWLDTLPPIRYEGLVSFGGHRYLGAAVRAAGDSTLGGPGAIALSPADSALARGPSAAMGSPVRLVVDETESELNAERLAVLDSLRQVAAEGGPEVIITSTDSAEAVRDSAAVASIRRVTRAFGLSDSVVQAEPPGRSAVVVAAGSDTISGVSDVMGSIGFTGSGIVRGVAFTHRGVRNTSFAITARLGLGQTLGGMFHTRVENPLTFVPIFIFLLSFLVLLAVAMFDLVMVGGMGRSITSAIRALSGGTTALAHGDLSHRIEVAGDDDLWQVAGEFNRMAVGLEHAREVEKERERLENELTLARQIQARLLPAGPPMVPGLDIAGLSESAREVGGDYFDHIPLGDGRVLLVVADVSGKGVPAALLMSGFRAALMSQDLARGEPAGTAGRLNEFLHRSVEPGRFVTAFVGFLDARSGRLTYANAGHNPPAIVRRDGSVEWLSTGGLILGIMAETPFERGEAVLEPGDLVALYTDGVTEGADARGDMWGEERLVESLRRGAQTSAIELAARIVAEVRGFEGEQGPADDITVLIARRLI